LLAPWLDSCISPQVNKKKIHLFQFNVLFINDVAHASPFLEFILRLADVGIKVEAATEIADRGIGFVSVAKTDTSKSDRSVLISVVLKKQKNEVPGMAYGLVQMSVGKTLMSIFTDFHTIEIHRDECTLALA
jgi:hypothetical protein